MKTKRSMARRPARATFSDELRDAIEKSEMTPYALGKASKVDPGVISRFLREERGITSDTIDRLASTIGLHVAMPTKVRGRPRRGKAEAASEGVNNANDGESGPDSADVEEIPEYPGTIGEDAGML